MAQQPLFNREWRRHHDRKDSPIASGVTAICFDDAATLIQILQDPTLGKVKAAGSHWSLSTSTLSDGVFLETNWPDGEPAAPRLSGFDVDMNELISDAALKFMVDQPPTPPQLLASDPCLSRDC